MSRRAVIMRAARWALTLGSALLILRVVDFASIPPILAGASALHLALAVGIALCHFFAGAWRWQQLMVLYDAAPLPYARLRDLYIASFFVSSVLPGTITGDGLRVYGTRNEAGGPTRAFAIVLLERLIGVGLLVVTGAVAWALLPAHPLLRLTLPRWEYGAALAAGAVALAAGGALFWRPLAEVAYAWAGRLLALLAQLPSLAVRRPLAAARVLAGSLVYQALSILIVFEALRATGVPITLPIFLTVIPAVTVLLILPISVQGIGVRESLYLAFLVPYGLEPEPILAGLALTYLIGVPFIVWGWVLFSRMSLGAPGAAYAEGTSGAHEPL